MGSTRLLYSASEAEALRLYGRWEMMDGNRILDLSPVVCCCFAVVCHLLNLKAGSPCVFIRAYDEKQVCHRILKTI